MSVVVTGDEVGLVKVWGVHKTTDAPQLFQWGIQGRNRAVNAMCFADEACKQVLVAQCDGNLTKLTMASSGGLSASNVARNYTVPTSGGLFVDRSGGSIRMLSVAEDGQMEIRELEDKEAKPSKFILPGPIGAAAYQNARLAFGGNENDLKVFDAVAGRVVWKAKNVETDFLDMRVPVWCAATCFMRPDSQNEIAVGTGYHQIRVYDIRQGQRRPAISFATQEKEGRTTTIAKHHTFFEHEVMLGDTLGNVYCVDVRKQVTTGRLHPSNPGSVRAIVFHPSQPCVATSGLGRKLYLHDARTRKLITKTYLKHKCTAVVFSKEPAFVDKYQIGADGNVYDDVWDYLNNVKRRKKKAAPEPEEGAESAAPAEEKPKTKKKKRSAKKISVAPSDEKDDGEDTAQVESAPKKRKSAPASK